jgi:thiamine-phosphate pyrophosphorylase
VDSAQRAGLDPAAVARAFLDGGATFLQIRAKHLPSARFLALCDAVVRAAEPYAASVIVNDRVDLAALSRAAGVHVGQEDLAPKAARDLLGEAAIVGYSTHSVSQIEGAIAEPISYVAVGPVFGSATKDTGYTAVGLELVRTAARLAGALPVVAIGGITLETAPAVLDAGASCVAVIGDLLAGGDPRAQAAAYARTLGL